MRSTRAKLARVLAMTGLLYGMVVNPALADHDDGHHHGHGHHGHYYYQHSYRPQVRYYGYEHRYYYYAPREEYYAPPPVYVVPPPPSWGLNLVFPLHVH